MPDEEPEERQPAQDKEDAASKRASSNGSDDLKEPDEDYDSSYYLKRRPGKGGVVREAREALKVGEADKAREAKRAKKAKAVHPISDASSDIDIKESVAYFRIRNEELIGPTDGPPYASICVLDPLITVERHSNNYHIAARFHLETTILDYSTHERFRSLE